MRIRITWERGLSPRVRGNPKSIGPLSLSTRSIPARTGEPPSPPPFRPTGRVYPRAYGGTDHIGPLNWKSQGLSPRVRGNRIDYIPAHACYGSIPARTGEPVFHFGGLLSSRVYPRAYGGTADRLRRCIIGRGLSPRVRGNRRVELGAVSSRGSIPARTGEPLVSDFRCHEGRVYPRAYGGTP